MKKCMQIVVIVTSVIITTSLFAETYSWTDDNGVRHFSNTQPPQEMDNIKKSVEIVTIEDERDKGIKSCKQYYDKCLK